MAQLGARLNGIQKAVGSNPISSTEDARPLFRRRGRASCFGLRSPEIRSIWRKLSSPKSLTLTGIPW